MQYEIKTVSEYMKALSEDWRKEKLLQLRDMILSSGPHLDESIEYKMLAYEDERGKVFHLNTQKVYVSLYVGNAHKVDPEGHLLEGIDVGKGCLRFRKSVSIQKTRIKEFIQQAIEMRKNRIDIDC